MLEKYIYIFDAIVFITGICSVFINLKRDKSMLSTVASISIGFLGVLIAHISRICNYHIDDNWVYRNFVVV